MAVLKSVRLGANDKARARAFYDAVFAALGVPPSDTPDDYHVFLYKFDGGQAFIVGPARDGNPSDPGNGGTVLFEAPSETAVRAWHAAGLAHGGTDAGRPEPKPQAAGAFGAYLRDPEGNKLACYHELTF